MENYFDLKNKTILLTGATGHLGSSIAKGLSEQGAKLILISRSSKNLEGLCKDLKGEHVFIIGDLEDRDFNNSIGDLLTEKGIESMEGLINCAYNGTSGDLNDVSLEDFDKAIQLNVISPFQLINTLRPFFQKSKSSFKSIVNISSMYGKVSPQFDAYDDSEGLNPVSYGASKGALLQMTRYLACRLSEDNINVNSISPGAFPNVENCSQSFVSKLESKIPLKRVGQPKELVGSVIFLSSPAASYITGADLAVDGGWTSW